MYVHYTELIVDLGWGSLVAPTLTILLLNSVQCALNINFLRKNYSCDDRKKNLILKKFTFCRKRKKIFFYSKIYEPSNVTFNI